MKKRLYAGIDLAWKIGNPFFVSLIEERKKGEGRILEVERKYHNDVVEYLEEMYENGKYDSLLVSIDAPLIVKNRTGIRECEKELAKEYRRFKASPHPTNLKKKYIRDLVELFMPIFIKRGYSITSDIQLIKKSIKKLLIEIYPHPAMIEIFALKERLKYKKGNLEQREKGLKKLIKYLMGLKSKLPQLNGVNEVTKGFLTSISSNSYTKMKKVEDCLDAIFCGYISFYIGFWLNKGEKKWKVFGNDTDGFIIVPTN